MFSMNTAGMLSALIWRMILATSCADRLALGADALGCDDLEPVGRTEIAERVMAGDDLAPRPGGSLASALLNASSPRSDLVEIFGWR